MKGPSKKPYNGGKNRTNSHTSRPSRPTKSTSVFGESSPGSQLVKPKNSPKPIPKPAGTSEYPMRINKYLALKKHSTRRGADEMISKKQVFINDRLAILGDKVGEKDRVEVRFRGKQVPYVYIAYNKPVGVVTHSAQNGEKEIKHEVAIRDIFPVGRLDKDSHGLIILTNDGRITERLLGPTHKHEKEYLVKTKNTLRSSFKEKMEAGVKIDYEKTAPCKVKILNERAFKVILTEGKKHQIRRMCVALFQEVEDLQRIRIMNIELGNLPVGSYRKLEGEELQKFLQLLDLA
jgi:23S rRNA pseudouridine2604 synthase